MIFVIVGLLLLVPGFFAYVTSRGGVTIALILGGVLVLIGSWIMPQAGETLPPSPHREPPTSLPPTEHSLRQERRGKTFVIVGLGFITLGIPAFVTHRAITVVLLIGDVLVLVGSWMERQARETPVLPPPPVHEAPGVLPPQPE